MTTDWVKTIYIHLTTRARQYSTISQPTVLTVALMLQCCVRLSPSPVCLSVTLCTVAKRCVLEQKLLLAAE